VSFKNMSISDKYTFSVFCLVFVLAKINTLLLFYYFEIRFSY
jgi:hypothetical protein